MKIERLKAFFGNKTVRAVLVLLGALLLLIVCYRVFTGAPQTGSYEPTAEEARLVSILKKIDGVRDAAVMITEEEGTAVGAVVVFEGEDGFLVRTRVAEIVASALGIRERDVRVYPAAS